MKHNSSYIYPQCAHLYTRKASNSFQSTVVYFSDGTTSQYNNFKKLVNLCHHRRDHDLDAEWHFLSLAKENRPVTKTSLQATVTNQILNPQHMFALAIAGINICTSMKRILPRIFKTLHMKSAMPGVKLSQVLNHTTVLYLFLKLSWK